MTINAKKIKLKYLETGHTYMSCDSFHAKISQQINKNKVIHTPEYCL